METLAGHVGGAGGEAQDLVTAMPSKPNGPAQRGDSTTSPRRKSVPIHQQGSRAWVLVPEHQAIPPRVTAPERTFTTEVEFLNGLRRMRLETGTSLRKIEQRTGGRLPRTTVHNMLKPDRTVLPARSEQVGLLVTGCGGSNMDARLWLDQWGRLRASRFSSSVRPPRPEPIKEVTAPPPPPRQTVIKNRLKRLVERRLAISLKGLLMVIGYTVLVVALTISVSVLLPLVL